MIKTGIFIRSVAVFDTHKQLVDWNSGFVEEFLDAAPLLKPGVSAREIHAACLLPERALDLSWASHGTPPPEFEYINNKLSILVAQFSGVNGHIFRYGQSRQATPRLHPAMPDESAEILRSVVLQTSAAVLKQREQETSRLYALALNDGLTGVANRRYFDEQLKVEWQRCQKSQQPLAMIFLDIDCFKRYNDFYGHQRGDECLTTIATTLQATLHRPRDVLARYGGEEFTCLLPDTELLAAQRKAEELERAVRALAIPHETSDVVPCVTISLGVTSVLPTADEDPSVLTKAADQLLYEAKAAGRGCVRSTLGTSVSSDRRGQ